MGVYRVKLCARQPETAGISGHPPPSHHISGSKYGGRAKFFFHDSVNGTSGIGLSFSFQKDSWNQTIFPQNSYFGKIKIL
ncbi:hypothetical protein [Agrobacterium albertimagni]|uniref:hypothetical protein n=1 Tax=Agrobacterium albertimagni TaxID=147266 RepID=UPI0012FD8BF2|nr:hypothetical protein [Agrobacterium albertimagni]